MKAERIVLLLACLASAPFAQVRTWHFSPDTVRHRNFGALDTVRLVNSGADTLRFDSVHLELVRPTATRYEVVFYPVQPSGQTQPYQVIHDGGVITYAGINGTQDPRSIAVRGQDSARFSGFKVGRHPLIVSKPAAIEPGDTVIVRAIFIASAGRGRDTLMVVGTEDFVNGVRPDLGPKGTRNHRLAFIDQFDPLGRRVEATRGRKIAPVLNVPAATAP